MAFGEGEVPPVVPNKDNVEKKVAKGGDVQLPADVHLASGTVRGTDQNVAGIVNPVEITDNAHGRRVDGGEPYGHTVRTGLTDFNKSVADLGNFQTALAGEIAGATSKEQLLALAQKVHAVGAQIGHAGGLLALLHNQHNNLTENVVQTRNV